MYMYCTVCGTDQKKHQLLKVVVTVHSRHIRDTTKGKLTGYPNHVSGWNI